VNDVVLKAVDKEFISEYPEINQNPHFTALRLASDQVFALTLSQRVGRVVVLSDENLLRVQPSAELAHSFRGSVLELVRLSLTLDEGKVVESCIEYR